MYAYTGFAQVYDTFMDNVPYDKWTEYLHSLLKEYGVVDGLILELGCGTGKVTRRLSKLGYDMIGIDYSDEMLEIAREKEYFVDEYEDEATCYGEYKDKEFDEVKYEATEDDSVECKHDQLEYETSSEDTMEGPSSILYLNQDMREFELFGTVAAIVCICDGMNYLTTEEDLLKVFQLANNYLNKDGVFIFDLNTEFKYKYLLADNVIAENREDCSFIWENYYNEDQKTNEYNMTIFVKQSEDEEEELEALVELDEKEELEALEESDELEVLEDEEEATFLRFRETHVQKAYSLDTIKCLIEKSGMEFVTAYDAFTKMAPREDSERIYVIAKEKYQNNKTYCYG